MNVLQVKDNAVQMRGISKSFGRVKANTDVDIDFARGEIHALLGENGAGKSTLMNILTGLYQQDAGNIEIYGKPALLGSPAQSLDLGIGMVHQHFKLIQSFTVVQNLHLGWTETPKFIDHAELNRRTKALSEQFGLDVRPESFIHELSAGAQQRVEILRVLTRGAEILILDEPTAVLTASEVANLFKAMRAMKKDGKTVIFISHKLDEVIEISDRVTTLRQGQVVDTVNTSDVDSQILANLMVGRDIIFTRIPRPDTPSQAITPVLEMKKVSARAKSGVLGLIDIDLSIRPNEILGIAGVAGNGQRQLTEIVTGIAQIESGDIEICGEDVSDQNPDQIAKMGVGHIPEDRLKSGFAGVLPVFTNAVLRHFRKAPICSGIWYSESNAMRKAQRMVDTAQVTPADIHIPLRNLSGGNQQRLIAERECSIADKLLVAAYPMRGLDLGAIESLRHMIMERRNNGAAVLLISEELTELMELADRIAVMHRGTIVGIVNAAEARLEQLGQMMGGTNLNSENQHGNRLEA